MRIPTYLESQALGVHEFLPVFLDTQQVCEDFPQSIPALARTLVELKLLTSTGSIDLQAVTSLVKSDVGLCFQVLRSARIDCREDDGLWRVSDCVVELGREISDVARPLHRIESANGGYLAVEAFWKHAQIVAAIAEAATFYLTKLEVNREKAYLAGLLHNLKSIPQALLLAGFGTDLFENDDWLSDCELPEFVNEVARTIREGRVANMGQLVRLVSFARMWVDMCLPCSETCLATRKRFTLSLPLAKNILNRLFPEHDPSLFLPLVRTLASVTWSTLEDERSGSMTLNHQSSELLVVAG